VIVYFKDNFFGNFINKGKRILNTPVEKIFMYNTVRLRTNLDKTGTEQAQNRNRTGTEQEQNRNRTGT